MPRLHLTDETRARDMFARNSPFNADQWQVLHALNALGPDTDWVERTKLIATLTNELGSDWPMTTWDETLDSLIALRSVDHE